MCVCLCVCVSDFRPKREEPLYFISGTELKGRILGPSLLAAAQASYLTFMSLGCLVFKMAVVLRK